jgi:hypothetical protein
MTSASAYRRTRGLRLAALLLWPLGLAFCPQLAMAANFEKLVMPGRVIAGHAEFESNCGACHDADSEQARPLLCIACHEGIGADRRDGTGFHGKSPAAQGNDCTICHTEHEGRDADIVELDAGLFDHGLTDFSLAGAHLSSTCGNCHVPDAPMRDAPEDCGACHSKDDPHEGRLGSDCSDCHSQSSWLDAVFDHELTGYTLAGGHSDVACGDCHQRNRFDQTSRACVDCHAVDDVHEGGRGDACGNCHTPDGWRGAGFDHARTTGFALADGHGGLECGDCHRREDQRDDFSAGCVACHAADDVHQGRLGANCGSCHDAATWSRSSFDHGSTGFALVAAHAELNGTSCHKSGADQTLSNSCHSCHALVEVHGGQLAGECSACHSQASWTNAVRFDHDLSDFPLLGLHAAVACGACHSDATFRDTPRDCGSCHLDDDPHEGTLGMECANCHSSNGWQATAFDHDTDTDFPLNGAHAPLACDACHANPASVGAGAPSACGACHRPDDVHDGQFGADCGSCHTTSSFSVITEL